MRQSAPKAVKNKNEKLVAETAKELFDLLGITGDFDIFQDEGVFGLNLQTQEGGMIIGYRGEILEALELILSLSVSKKIGEFTRVSLEVGDYKKNKESWLGDLVYRTKERVLVSKEEIPLPNLRAWERRIVHLMLREDREVFSESVGEGRDRTLVIKPR
ncbi:hypothetical protein M1615_04600 [Patescibacteria group bacterium]|nr:hypothetical protein [Patescibacteria group bacterium]MCL5010184.1 hypothetical protein [Patescibacteria group bacterium]